MTNTGCKLGPIGHDPAELLAFVSVFSELSEEELNSTLQAVFDRQYQLAGAEVTETRETVDADGKTVTRQVRVFEITLTVIPFSEAAAGQLTRVACTFPAIYQQGGIGLNPKIERVCKDIDKPGAKSVSCKPGYGSWKAREPNWKTPRS